MVRNQRIAGRFVLPADCIAFRGQARGRAMIPSSEVRRLLSGTPQPKHLRGHIGPWLQPFRAVSSAESGYPCSRWADAGLQGGLLSTLRLI
jgi:hypothetical protein